METRNPPPGELRFCPVRKGRYRLIVLDRHHSVHEEVHDTLEGLNSWLKESKGEIGAPLDLADMLRVRDLLDEHGAVHVRTSYDADLVFVKGGAPRG